MQLKHRLSALRQLHLHFSLNTWLIWAKAKWKHIILLNWNYHNQDLAHFADGKSSKVLIGVKIQSNIISR